MGGWTLEIAKMALYLSFPVAAFHLFNTPAHFEKYVIQKKREMYPPEDQQLRDELKLLFRDMKSGELKSKIEQLNHSGNSQK